MRAFEIMVSSGRTEPLPPRPWTMRQTWHDLLFMHWPVATAMLRRCIPAPLEIDEHAGTAWVAVVPFWMSNIRLRGLPAIPGASSFPELNVRTYVRYRGRTGVYFMSLDAPHRLLSAIARRWYGLPYVRATISIDRVGDSIHFRSMRELRMFRHANLDVTYRPLGAPKAARDDPLTKWLLERYRLFTVGKDNHVYQAEICHAPWHVQPAQITLDAQTMTDAHGIALSGPPATVHFCKKIDTLIWSPTSCGSTVRPVVADLESPGTALIESP